MRCIGEGCTICGRSSKNFEPLLPEHIKRLEKATDEQKKQILFDPGCPLALRYWAFDVLYPKLKSGKI